MFICCVLFLTDGNCEFLCGFEDELHGLKTGIDVPFLFLFSSRFVVRTFSVVKAVHF